MMRNLKTRLSLIISFFVVVISVFTITYKGDNVSYAITAYEKPNMPVITSFAPSTIEDNALKLTVDANSNDNNYYVQVWNLTLNRTDNFVPKWPLAYQKLNGGTEYSIMARTCKKYETQHVCSDWTPQSKATTKGKMPLSVTLEKKTFTYDGTVKTPIVIVKSTNGDTLKENVDYTLTYNKNSKSIGTYTIVAKGIGQYGGELSNTYQIVPPMVSIKNVELNKNSIKVTIDDKSNVKHGAYYEASIYKKDTKTPIKSYRTLNKTITFNNLNSNTNYKIKVRTSKKVGNTYITSNYSSPASITTQSDKKISLKSSNISLDKTSFIYTGNVKKPSVKVKNGSALLVKNKDYKLSYKNNTNIGQATAVIKGIGNYTGTINKIYKIYPGKVTISDTSKTKNSITIKWEKVKGATYYKVGYKKSSGNYKYIDNIKNTSKKISDLKQGTNYIVKVKACKKVNSKAYCGDFSKEKTIKTTKVVKTTSSSSSNNSSTSSTTVNTPKQPAGNDSRNKNTAGGCGTNEKLVKGICTCISEYTRQGGKCVKTYNTNKCGTNKKELNGKCISINEYNCIKKGSHYTWNKEKKSCIYSYITKSNKATSSKARGETREECVKRCRRKKECLITFQFGTKCNNCINKCKQ